MSENIEVKKLRHALASPITNLICSLELYTLYDSHTALVESEAYESIMYSIAQLRALVGGRDAVTAQKQTFCIVDELKHLIKAYKKPNQIKVVASLPDETISICAKKSAFVTIMHALLNNATESYHSNAGSRTIRVSLVPLSDRVTIFISDSGSGMSPINTLFFKMRYFSNKEHKSGLGMEEVISTLKSEFGGKLSFETKQHVGTTMVVEIPLHQ